MDFTGTPIYDDFESEGGAKDNNYMRILFRPGYAVQARELTQIQSIIQNQIKSFGDHVFQDGSPVHGGNMTLDTKIKSVFLTQSDTVSLTSFKDTIVTNTVGGTSKQAKVLAVDESVSSDAVGGALLVKYLTGDEFINSEVIQQSGNTLTQVTLLSANSTQTGSVVSINEGIFYVSGFFIKVPEQTIVLDSLSTTPTYRIGLEISEAIIDESQDTNLLDPAQGSFNYQAPGATRYQYNLLLSKRTLDSVDDSKFFELLRVEDGAITKQITYPIYSDLGKTMARRTYDESGNYTVRPFRASAANSSNSSNFTLLVEPGKAYVKGFEFETLGSTKVEVPRARDYSTANTFDLSVGFGNYLTVANVFSGNTGFFDQSSYSTVDLHAVPTANINTATSNAYSWSKIGTARVRDLEYLANNLYSLYTLDMNITPISFNPSTNGTTSNVYLTANSTTFPNAYVGMTIRSVTGNAAGEIRTIASYNTTSKYVVVDRPFSKVIDTTCSVLLEPTSKFIEAVTGQVTSYAANVFYAKNAASAIYPSVDVSNDGKSVSGDTIVYSTDFNKMVFTFPEANIKQSSIVGVSYDNRKTYYNATFTGGNYTISLGPNEQFGYGFSGSYLDATIANQNVFVVIKDKKTSSFANGQVIVFGGSNTVHQDSTSAITIATAAGVDFIADVIVTSKVTDGGTATHRTKTLIGDTSKTTMSASDLLAYATSVANTTNVKVDTANGYVWFQTVPTTLTSGNTQSLYLPDVIKIIKVFDSGNVSFAPNTTNARDVTSNYLLESGQRDNYYDHATIKLRDGRNPPTGQTAFMLQYYQHVGTTGFFDADSYSANNYAGNYIPVYQSPSYGSINLRDSIDFRPTRKPVEATFQLQGTRTPVPDQAMEMGSYSYYLSRADRLVLTDTGEFKNIKGVPSKTPLVPNDPSNSMTLYTTYVPAYTYVPEDVRVTYVENKRYTMRDIGNLENRVKNVEYYTSLSLLENQASLQSVLYTDGVSEKEKYGMVVDKFDDFTVADTTADDFQTNCVVNKLMPLTDPTQFGLEFDSADGDYTEEANVYSLGKTETPCIVQNTATKTVKVNPYNFAKYIAKIYSHSHHNSFGWSMEQPAVVIETQPQKQEHKTPSVDTPYSMASQEYKQYINGVIGHVAKVNGVLYHYEANLTSPDLYNDVAYKHPEDSISKAYITDADKT